MSPIERARRYLRTLGPAISGQAGHHRTYRAAAVLIDGLGLGYADALTLLREWNVSCQPPWSDRELLHKIDSVRSKHATGHLLRPRERQKWGNEKTYTPRRSVPLPVSLNPVTAAERFLEGFRCSDVELAEASPIRLDNDWNYDGALMADWLYRPGEYLNFVTEFYMVKDRLGQWKAKPNGHGLTLERDDAIRRFLKCVIDTGRAGAWLRMNPVDGCGVSDTNVTAFRFALLESDGLPVELQLSLLARLPLPIAAILSSGGRSYHAWIQVDARGADEYRRTIHRLIELVSNFGLDHKNKKPLATISIAWSATDYRCCW